MAGEATPPWAFLPGHLCDERMWTSLIDCIGLETTRVVHGDLTQDDTVQSMAMRLVERLDRPTVIVGFSLGGLVALRVLSSAPEKVAGLVMLNSNARADALEHTGRREDQRARAVDGGYERIVRDEMMPHYFSKKCVRPAAADALIRGMAARAGVGVFERQSRAIQHRGAFNRGALPDIPVLVVGGSDDPLSPPEWQTELRALFHSSELVMLDGCGHFSPLQATARVAEAISDWAERNKLL